MKFWRVVNLFLALAFIAIASYLLVATIPYRHSGYAEKVAFYLQHHHDVAQIYAAEPIVITASDCDPFAISLDGTLLDGQYVQELASCQGGGFIAQFAVQEASFRLESGRSVHIELDGSQVVWVQVAMAEMTVMVFIMAAVMMAVLSSVFFSEGPY